MNKFRDINQAINRVERQENVGRPRKPNMKALTVRMDTVLPDILSGTRRCQWKWED